MKIELLLNHVAKTYITKFHVSLHPCLKFSLNVNKFYIGYIEVFVDSAIIIKLKKL